MGPAVQDLPAPAVPSAASVRPAAGVPSVPRAAEAGGREQVERPLFTMSRRPPVAAQPSPPEPAPEPAYPPPRTVIGLVERADGTGVLLLRLADDRVVRAAGGEEVDGWRVSRIASDAVEFERGAERVRLPARISAAEGIVR